MKTYRSGEKVGYGLYVAPNVLDVRFVGSEGETLEGKDHGKYVRLPVVLMVLASPIIGGVFVLAFPLLVVLIAAYAVLEFGLAKIGSVAKANAHLAFMRWEPTAAYLNKKNKKEKENEKKTNS